MNMLILCPHCRTNLTATGLSEGGAVDCPTCGRRCKLSHLPTSVRQVAGGLASPPRRPRVLTDIVIGVGSALVIAGALVLVWLTFAPKPDTGGPELTPPSLQVKPEHMTGPRVAQPGAGPDAPPHKPGGPSNSTSVPKD